MSSLTCTGLDPSACIAFFAPGVSGINRPCSTYASSLLISDFYVSQERLPHFPSFFCPVCHEWCLRLKD
jgi:hypothetical protein